MDKGTTYVALDDSKRRIVAGILRPAHTAPELREIPNDPVPRQKVIRVAGALFGRCQQAQITGW